jgi:hypothetical protein
MSILSVWNGAFYLFPDFWSSRLQRLDSSHSEFADLMGLADNVYPYLGHLA